MPYPAVTIMNVGGRIGVGVADIRVVEATRIAPRSVRAIGIAAVDEADIGIAAGRGVLQLAEIMARPGEHGPLVDEIALNRGRARLRDRNDSRATAARADTAAGRRLGRHSEPDDRRSDKRVNGSEHLFPHGRVGSIRQTGLPLVNPGAQLVASVNA